MIGIRAGHITVGRSFRTSPETAWDLLTDTARWPLWGPSVRRVVCSDRHIRLGSSGRIFTPVGLVLPFIITEYVPGSYWTWVVAGLKATGHRLVRLDSASCRIVFEMPLYWLPYCLVCRLALRRLAGILEG